MDLLYTYINIHINIYIYIYNNYYSYSKNGPPRHRRLRMIIKLMQEKFIDDTHAHINRHCHRHYRHCHHHHRHHHYHYHHPHYHR